MAFRGPRAAWYKPRMDDAWLVDEAAWAALQPYRDAPGVVVADAGGVRWFRTRIGYEGFNGVLSARLPEAGLAGAVERALGPFREAGLPLLWHLGPTSSPPVLARALAAAGLTHYEDEPGMVADLRDLGPPPAVPAALEVRQVGDEDDLAAWARVLAAAPPGADVGSLVELRAPGALGPDPPAPHLLGLLDGAPVACAAVHVGGRRDGPAPAAWLEQVVTPAGARRLGVGTALTHACLALARARGLGRAALTASPDGAGIYRRLGFRDRCTVTRYLGPPPG
jgi:GNAT superfamily N-acetyltransferase